MINQLDQISESMIARYSGRYAELGYDVKTLGWGSSEQQYYRFKQAIDHISFNNPKSILDIGCGFGDFLALLIAESKPLKEYYGWDINPDLIEESRKIWEGKSIKSTFEVMNISKHISSKPTTDIAFMFGVLNLNLKEEFDNYDYSKMLISNAFTAVKELLVVDFLSNHLNPDYPKEDFVFYHDPAVMLNFALTLTPNVVLKHNYSPIPQKEFMMFLYK
jgi:SAM-dependent methyltransferase